MKYFFFDLDGTITESRQKINKEMKEALGKLPNVIVISGAQRSQMEDQLDGLGITYLMAQSGNDVPSFWFNKLTEEETDEIYQHISKVAIIKDDMIEDRGAQIALSFTGHHANVDLKKNWDIGGGHRKKFLEKHPFHSDTLTCRVAGTTCLDYTKKDGTKGCNIKRLLDTLNWPPEECIYVGDALYPGGNDETVIGVIKTIGTENPKDTIRIIKFLQTLL